MCNPRAIPVIAALLVSSAAVAIGQTQAPAGTPKFDVSSVKPCKGNFDPGFKGAGGTQSPGRLDLNCQTLRVFITRAYVYYRDGHFNLFRSLPEIDGAPDWIEDRYSITAIPEGIASQDMMNGPMMQTLLEDRFKLKIHRVIKEVPVYELTVAKGGLKLPRFRPGECIPIDWTKVPVVLPPDQKNCINRTTRKGADMIVQLDASSIEAFSKLVLSTRLDRPVIDKTGLTGLFDFHLRVLVCMNMAFHGDFQPLLAKHSKSFSLVDAISVGVDRMQRNFEPMRRQVETWQAQQLTIATAKLIIYRAFIEDETDAPKHLARRVHELYFAPKHEDFQSRTMWSLSNAFTSAFKELDPIPQFKATAKLGPYLERVLGS
jgi:uncharacterized protein (TIGR03435 family)